MVEKLSLGFSSHFECQMMRVMENKPVNGNTDSDIFTVRSKSLAKVLVGSLPPHSAKSELRWRLRVAWEPAPARSMRTLVKA